MIRLFENKDTYELTCQQIADLLNFENGNHFNECTYRKKWVDFSRGREFERSHCFDKNLAVQVQELKKAKIKLFDERTELNKQLRSQARFEDRLDKIEAALVSNGSSKFDIPDTVSFSSDNDLLVCLSDLHIGATYYTAFGCYDSDIAKDRLQKYLANIIEIQKTHKSENCYVALLGDLISGSIHLDLTVSNRENIIEQVKLAAELVTNFIYELSKHFNMVTVSSVNGNHSRLTTKQDALKDERLDDLIPWYVKSTLSHLTNVHVMSERLDSTVDTIVIRDLVYAIVHGDADSFTKSGAANLMLMLGFRPYAVVFGHMHQCGLDDAGGIKLIRSGSTGGSGDEYTVQKRPYGKPNQMVCVCNSKGVIAYYPIELE